ncbi:MAG: hypothetical protein WBB98_03910 [Xanthobacteraceae bacterium]
MTDIDTGPENFNLVKAGMYDSEVRVWAAKARGLAEVLACHDDGMVTGGDRIVAAWAIECYTELNNANKVETEHGEFAQGIIRDHGYKLSDELTERRGDRDYVPLSVFENTLMQRALRRYSKFLLDELKARPKQAIAA